MLTKWILGKNKVNRSRFGYVLVWIRNLIFFFLVSSFFAVIITRIVPVKLTPLMLIRVCQQITEGKSVKMEQRWLPIDRMSSHMINAVVASEDNKFMRHDGFDFEAITKAQKLNKKGKKLYGASTISQQVAKNVFLWPSRSWLRKGLECYFTVLIEFFWTKKRIMEVYLNVVELGDGIYGIEAASRFYYKHSASRLSREEACMLTVCLPNPRAYNPVKPTSYLCKRKSKIMSLMKKLNRTPWGLAN